MCRSAARNLEIQGYDLVCNELRKLHELAAIVETVQNVQGNVNQKSFFVSCKLVGKHTYLASYLTSIRILFIFAIFMSNHY